MGIIGSSLRSPPINMTCGTVGLTLISPFAQISIISLLSASKQLGLAIWDGTVLPSDFQIEPDISDLRLSSDLIKVKLANLTLLLGTAYTDV